MTCPNLEDLAALAEQRLGDADRDALLDHAAACDDCRHVLIVLGSERRARGTARRRPASRSWAPWIAAAAAVALSIVSLLVFSGRRAAEEPAPVVARPVPPPPEPPKPPPPIEPVPIPVPAPLPPPAVKEPPAPRPLPPPTPPAPPVEKPAPPAVPPPPTPTPAPAPVVPAPRPPTIAVLATIDRVEGEVAVLGAAGRAPAKAGQAIHEGDGLECAGPQGLALLSYPDRTRLELAAGTLIRLVPERITIEKGTLKAEVSKQAEGHPLVFATPHGEAKVLGTVLRLHVDPDPKKGTRLEVEEGKVELKNLAGRTVRVEGGHQAVAATGLVLASKLLPREEVLLALDLEDAKKPVLVETGTVERGPGGRLCLAGDPEPGGASRLFIGDGANGLFNFSGEEVLSFDYWVDPQATQVNFNVWNRTQKLSHEGVATKLVTGKWTHFSVRLADLVAAGGGRLKEGDWVINIYMQGVGGPPRRFYVDNLQIIRPRSLHPVKK